MQTEDYEYLYKLEEEFWWFAGMREITASVLDDFCVGGKGFKVLDAGCGTGLNLEWLRRYAIEENIFGLDFSSDAIDFCRTRNLKNLVQASATDLPFADESLDLILMCGVLEYTPLDTGLREAARVLKKGAPLVLLPVKPSLVGSMLELLYKFKIHPIDNVRVAASRYFNIVGNHEFPITEPIAWSKTIFLLEKK